MRLTQVRNATQICAYGGKKFLIDPMLSKKGAFPGFAGTARSELRNPTVELPFGVDFIIDVDAVIVTHTHPDHWDDAAVGLIPKDKPIFVQNESDQKILQSQGFKDLRIMSETSKFGDVSIIKTDCRHGTEEAYADPVMAELLGKASGMVLKHPDEETIYFAGDSIWCQEVKDAVRKYQPNVVVMNLGYAHVLRYGPIIFGKEDVLRMHLLLPEAKIVATHLEAINHCLMTRAELRTYVRDNEIQAYVSVPDDGESLSFSPSNSPVARKVVPSMSGSIPVAAH